jgi:hypothetical protein
MSAVQAPSWFTRERYSFIRGLGARGWLSTDVQLGRLLGLGNVNPEFDKKGIELAKKELSKAIASIPALAAQVASEAQAEK